MTSAPRLHGCPQHELTNSLFRLDTVSCPMHRRAGGSEYTFLDRLKQYPSTRESRLVAADNFLHDIQAMDDSVPALRPDIMDWVISELDRLTRKHGRLGSCAP